jgi:phage portal protein BeeE
MGLFQTLTEPFSRLLTKSWGERQYSKMTGFTGSGAWGYGSFGSTWGRQELGNHYTGFNYLAIQPLMKELSGMTPHAAHRVDGFNVKEAKSKALETGNWAEYRRARSRLLNPYERSKAIAPVQTHEELEPVSTNHALIRLLRNPNGPDTAATFFRKLVMFWRIYGEFYIWLVPPKLERLTGVKQPPVEMWVLPSHWVWPKHDPENEQIFSGFEIRPYAGYYPVEAAGNVGIGWHPGAGKKAFIPADQVVYYAEPNPTGFFNGYSPLTAISHWVDCSDAIDRSRTAQFQNGAFPGIVVEFDKSIVEPDQAQIERLRARIEATYVGVKRTGRSMILSPGVKIKPIDHKVQEMAYVDSLDQVKDLVFAAHGTGQSIVGLVEQTTFNNVWGARANFYSNTIKPMCTILSEIFTEKIASLFDKDLVCYWPDTTPVDPDLELRNIDTMLKNNVLTINEVCSLKGYEPKDWGDEPLDKLRFDWGNAAQPGAVAAGDPNAVDPKLVGQPGPPTDPTLNQSPLHDGNKKPEEDVAGKHNRVAQNLRAAALNPSKNGKHSMDFALRKE